MRASAGIASIPPRDMTRVSMSVISSLSGASTVAYSRLSVPNYALICDVVLSNGSLEATSVCGLELLGYEA